MSTNAVAVNDNLNKTAWKFVRIIYFYIHHHLQTPIDINTLFWHFIIITIIIVCF